MGSQQTRSVDRTAKPEPPPAFVRNEPITAGKLIGVALGMAGVAVLIGPGVLLGAQGELLGEVAVAAAALCYAVNGLVARSCRACRWR
jgi:drug/metabolite transporter (DMT)-like permease